MVKSNKKSQSTTSQKTNTKEFNSKLNHEYYYNRGMSYMKLGNFEQAGLDFNLAISFNPKSNDHYYASFNDARSKYNNLEKEYAEINQFKEANDNFDKAIMHENLRLALEQPPLLNQNKNTVFNEGKLNNKCTNNKEKESAGNNSFNQPK